MPTYRKIRWSLKSFFGESWLAFDRTGQVGKLLAERITYTDAERMAYLDQALLGLDQHLKWKNGGETWERLGPAVAFDRLQAAYEALVAGLFAYNRRWRPWRAREMSYLLALPWLPDHFGERVVSALNAPAADQAGYLHRFHTLQSLSDELLAQLATEEPYGIDPIERAFIRSHDKPGYAWNMDGWNEVYANRGKFA